MINELIRRFRERGDAGVALVAAVAVGLIGVTLTTIVITQVIVVTNDAARDRIRTAEIHSAEGALDATLKALEVTLPCEQPAFSPITVGGGATAVEVTVTIQYFDEAGPLTECAADVIVGSPNKATVTAVARPLTPRPGIDPVRSIEAQVRLTPQVGLELGTSIFAGDSLDGVNSGSIVPTDPDHPAGVWIDSGDYECSNFFRIEGDLVVPAGGIRMLESCSVSGFAWARTYFDSRNSLSGHRVGGDTMVYEGGMSVANPTSFGGNIMVRGEVGGGGFSGSTVLGSVCSANIGSPCGTIVEYVSRGFPRVDYVPADWTEKGFTNKTIDGIDGWANDVVAGWNLTAAREATFRSNPCSLNGTLSNRPINLTATKSTYDLRTCDFSTNNTVTLKLYADTVIFARSFTSNNQFAIESGDGGAYQIWFIVPSGGAPGTPASTDCYPDWYCPGNISLSQQTRILEPVSIFLYTPGTITIAQHQKLNGQLYGQYVNINNNFELKYVPMGIPGVDLGTGMTVTASGYSVEILNKRELRE